MSAPAKEDRAFYIRAWHTRRAKLALIAVDALAAFDGPLPAGLDVIRTDVLACDASLAAMESEQ